MKLHFFATFSLEHVKMNFICSCVSIVTPLGRTTHFTLLNLTKNDVHIITFLLHDRVFFLLPGCVVLWSRPSMSLRQLWKARMNWNTTRCKSRSWLTSSMWVGAACDLACLSVCLSMYAHHHSVSSCVVEAIYLSIYLSINQSINYISIHQLTKFFENCCRRRWPFSAQIIQLWPHFFLVVCMMAKNCWVSANRSNKMGSSTQSSLAPTSMDYDIIFIAMLSCACKNDIIIILHKNRRLE